MAYCLVAAFLPSHYTGMENQRSARERLVSTWPIILVAKVIPKLVSVVDTNSN
jgi:hypothetical protein